MRELKILIFEGSRSAALRLKKAILLGYSPFGKSVVVQATLNLTQTLKALRRWQPDIILIDLDVCPDCTDWTSVIDAIQCKAPEALRIALCTPATELNGEDLTRLAAAQWRLDGAINEFNPTRIMTRKMFRTKRGPSRFEPWFDPGFGSSKGLHDPAGPLLESSNQPSQEASGMTPSFVPPSRPLSISKTLTKQERQIIKLRAQGHSYDSIAKQLRISKNTVATHLKRIRGKLSLSKSSELYAYCVEQGILNP